MQAWQTRCFGDSVEHHLLDLCRSTGRALTLKQILAAPEPWQLNAVESRCQTLGSNSFDPALAIGKRSASLHQHETMVARKNARKIEYLIV